MQKILISAILLLGVLGERLSAGEDDIVRVGDEAPPFVGSSSDGASVELATHRGSVVLLNFFATWCPPCKAEMPLLEAKVWRAYRDRGLVLLSIGREHSTEEVAAYKAKMNLSFTFLADPNRAIYGKYATGYIPRCYLVGKDGKVKFVTVGFDEADFARLVAAVKDELDRT